MHKACTHDTKVCARSYRTLLTKCSHKCSSSLRRPVMTASPRAQRKATQRVAMRARLPWAHSRSSVALSHPSGIVAPIRDALRPSRRARVPAARARRSAASSAGCCPRCALRVAPQQLAVLLCAQAASGAERQPLEVATQLALLLFAPLLPKEDDRLDGDLGLTHGPPHEQAHVPAYEPACETSAPSACAAAAATSPAGRGPGTTPAARTASAATGPAGRGPRTAPC